MDISALYKSIDVDKLDEFIAEKQEENLHLDFKLVNEAGMSRDDRKNLAKALSGFANSDGGIVVWGMDARPNDDGINCAVEKRETSPLSKFIAKLNEYTGSHVNPDVEGVVHKKIVVKNDSGFAVTLIPTSDSGPHMAKGGEDRYYKRSGDRFIKMEHFDVEDMFGRRVRPNLSLCYRIKRGLSRQGDKLGFFIILSIFNDGRGTAHAPYLSVEIQGPCRIYDYGLDGNMHEGLPRLVSHRDSRATRYGGMADMCIHSGTTHDVLVLNGMFDPNATGFDNLIINYEIAAEALKLRADKIVIDVNTLIAKVLEVWR